MQLLLTAENDMPICPDNRRERRGERVEQQAGQNSGERDEREMRVETGQRSAIVQSASHVSDGLEISDSPTRAPTLMKK